MRLLLDYVRRLRLSPRHLVIAVGAGVVGLFILSFAWLQVTRVARHKVEQQLTRVSHKLGVPIDIGHWVISPTGAHFEDVRIGAEANILLDHLDAGVDLNPFSSGFGHLDTVTVDHVRVKTALAGLKNATAGLGDMGLSNDAPSEGGRSLSLTKVFAAFPAQKLRLASGSVDIVDDDGELLISVAGLKLILDKRANRIAFRVARLRGPGGMTERLLSGHIEPSRQSETGSERYRFVLKRLREDKGKQDLWMIKGALAADFSEASIGYSLHQLPALLAARAEAFLGKRPTVNLKGVLDLRRDGDKWHFSTHTRSLGSTALIPVVSSRPIGPVAFDLRARGYLQNGGRGQRLAALEQATLSLPDRRSGRYGKAPVRIDLNGVASLGMPSDGRPATFAASGNISLPPMACQAILDASPTGILPALTDFKLEGTAGASLAISVDSQRPQDASFSMRDSYFGCKVLDAPYAFTAERLAGPFSLQREVGKDDQPVSVNVNPTGRDFSPLETVAKNIAVAFVASEDAGFYTHKGIDGAALETAARRDLAERRIALGGSTITMQTVKNLFLSQERTLSRKLQELFLAWHLENILSKERILEIYMNIVELGPGIYGVAQASEQFFGKRAGDLTLLESAYLATLLPSPKARYRYFCNGKLTPGIKDMVDSLLKRMLNLNRINRDLYIQAMSASLHFNDDARLAAPECSRRPAEEDDHHDEAS